MLAHLLFDLVQDRIQQLALPKHDIPRAPLPHPSPNELFDVVVIFKLVGFEILQPFAQLSIPST